MFGNFLVTAQLTSSQEGLSCMELVSYNHLVIWKPEQLKIIFIEIITTIPNNNNNINCFLNL
jgi:hypothetical protein